MSSVVSVARPGFRLGSLPESYAFRENEWLAQIWQRYVLRKKDSALSSFNQFRHRLAAIVEAEEKFSELDLLARNCAVMDLRKSLAGRELQTQDLIQAFAMVRIAVEQTLGVRLYDEQLYAGWCLVAGNFIEMQTGEGKTLTAALTATVMGLACVPVHVITSNEYLVQRDAMEIEPLYRWFGLSVGRVLAEQNDGARRSAYGCNIVYCTHQQLVFDYLRDAQGLQYRRRGLAAKLSNLLDEDSWVPIQRGLCFAIVDEADSVLIDDARTPLILAEKASKESFAKGEAAVALAIARALEEKTHFLLKRETRRARLTEAGLQFIRRRTAQLSGSWQFERYRSERVAQALAALHLYRRDIDYLVQNDRVDLIDANTGRPSPQRRLQHGLHRLLEVKERCTAGDETNPISALSFQRFFPRYHRLSGMSGTVWEVRGELRKVYGPAVLAVPTVRVDQRIQRRTYLMGSRELQLQAVLSQVVRLRASGRAVLIGTRTVELSESVSHLLSSKNIAHEVLNARQDSREAEVIASAGRTGQITVATNMAGRGTNIKLDPATASAGGLHVMSLEINESRRLDRQLCGRSGRQGDPGSSQELFCVDDEVLVRELNPLLYQWLTRQVSPGQCTSSAWAIALIRHAQKNIENRHRQQRIAVARGQSLLQRALAVGGCSE